MGCTGGLKGEQREKMSFGSTRGFCASLSYRWSNHLSDFLAHIQQTIATDPTGVWVFITDQLNIHQSESLVRWVASVCAINEDLGVMVGWKSAPSACVRLQNRKRY